MSNKVYDTFKKIAIALPLLGAFYEALALAWELPFSEAIMATCLALTSLINGWLQKSSNDYFSDKIIINSSKCDSDGDNEGEG